MGLIIESWNISWYILIRVYDSFIYLGSYHRTLIKIKWFGEASDIAFSCRYLGDWRLWAEGLFWGYWKIKIIWVQDFCSVKRSISRCLPNCTFSNLFIQSVSYMCRNTQQGQYQLMVTRWCSCGTIFIVWIFRFQRFYRIPHGLPTPRIPTPLE